MLNFFYVFSILLCNKDLILFEFSWKIALILTLFIFNSLFYDKENIHKVNIPFATTCWLSIDFIFTYNVIKEYIYVEKRPLIKSPRNNINANESVIWSSYTYIHTFIFSHLFLLFICGMVSIWATVHINIFIFLIFILPQT